MDVLEINLGNGWKTVSPSQIIYHRPNGYQVRFSKPQLGAVQPSPPLVRWNGLEAISPNWSDWAPEAAGMVEVIFTLP